jgi:manganese oxidase
MYLNRLILVCGLSVLLPQLALAQSAPPTPGTSEPRILANDNRSPTGTLLDRVLTVRLVAEQGAWQPEGPGGRTFSVQAFREETGSPSIPGPLVRVPVGTEIHVSIRNNLPRATLRMFGLQQRPAAAAYEPLQIPAGETREVRFLAGEPGTYHYWATTTGRSLAQRNEIEGQLGGAFVVDPPGARNNDRILVVGLWRKPATAAGAPVDLGVINGRSWPLTESFDYRVGETAHWRVINQSVDGHAMHLHGMYFRVLANGDGLVSRPYAEAAQPLVVTEHMVSGETIDMQWTPERPGNWLFHCHMFDHMSPDADSLLKGAHQHGTDASSGMAGIVMGIRVTGETSTAPASTLKPRRFTLRISEEPNRYGDRPGYRVTAEGIETSRLSPGPAPGPTLVLTRGEPVEVEIVNEMRDPTAVHWHGIELQSYFDGVPGWGGTGGSTTPPIDAGRRFTAKFTPPRAGTFIYHTHWHDEAQLSGGLYGALIVVEPGQRYDATTDHVFIASYDGPYVRGQQREPVVINGNNVTVPALNPGVGTTLRPNMPNRLRLINITPGNVALTFVLTDGFRPVSWTPVAKDGASLPPAQRISRDSRQLVSVGETYDFEIQPAPGQRLWLEVRRGNGEWLAQMLLATTP